MFVQGCVVGFIGIDAVGTGVRLWICGIVRGYVVEANDVVGANVGGSIGTGVVGMIVDSVID